MTPAEYIGKAESHAPNGYIITGADGRAVANVRGWGGMISRLGLGMTVAEADTLSCALADFITDAINEKIARESPTQTDKP